MGSCPWAILHIWHLHVTNSIVWMRILIHAFFILYMTVFWTTNQSIHITERMKRTSWNWSQARNLVVLLKIGLLIINQTTTNNPIQIVAASMDTYINKKTLKVSLHKLAKLINTISLKFERMLTSRRANNCQRQCTINEEKYCRWHASYLLLIQTSTPDTDSIPR